MQAVNVKARFLALVGGWGALEEEWEWVVKHDSTRRDVGVCCRCHSSARQISLSLGSNRPLHNILYNIKTGCASQ